MCLIISCILDTIKEGQNNVIQGTPPPYEGSKQGLSSFSTTTKTKFISNMHAKWFISMLHHHIPGTMAYEMVMSKFIIILHHTPGRQHTNGSAKLCLFTYSY